MKVQEYAISQACRGSAIELMILVNYLTLEKQITVARLVKFTIRRYGLPEEVAYSTITSLLWN